MMLRTVPGPNGPRRARGDRLGRFASSTLLLIAAVLAACAESATDARPSQLLLQVVSGDSQIGPAYTELPEPIVVRVVDARDQSPVAGQIINFRVVEGGGSVFGGAAQTDTQGIALDYWTLGDPGPQRLEARAVSSDGEKLVFGSLTAFATSPADTVAAAIQCFDTTATWGPNGSCTPDQAPVGSVFHLLFRVVNADVVPIPNITMRFDVWASVPDSMHHPGTVQPVEAVTDSLGMVGVTWTLDTIPGMYALQVVVDSAGGRHIHHAEYVHAFDPDSVWVAVQCLDPSGAWRDRGTCDYPAQPVGATVPVVFRVLDHFRLPAAGTPVFFRVDTTAAGTGLQDGRVVPDSGLTDSLGTITALWTLGQFPGLNRLVATAVASGGPTSVAVTMMGQGDTTGSSIVSWVNPAGGSWHDSTNWDAGRVPGLGDTALVKLPGPYTVAVASGAGVAVHGFEFGAPDSSERTLLVDGGTLRIDGSGVVHAGGTIQLTAGSAYGTWGHFRIRGGTVRLSDAAWRLQTVLESGSFVFEGASPNVIGPSIFTTGGGSIIWRNADTLLVLEDSTYLDFTNAATTFETRAVIVPGAGETGIPSPVLGNVRFVADSAGATSLTLYGLDGSVNGAVTIDEVTAVPSGTVFDLIRLENGATLTGAPTIGTAGYTLVMNPEAGIGLRVVRN